MAPTGLRSQSCAMSQLGQSRRFGDARTTSALPLIADIRRKDRHVRNVPQASAKFTAAIFALRCRMRKRTVIVNDMMQRGYRYQLTEPAGRNFDLEFTPQLTPKEMLRLGVFCGKYMTDTRKEFPKSWFENAKLAKNGSPNCPFITHGCHCAVLTH